MNDRHNYNSSFLSSYVPFLQSLLLLYILGIDKDYSGPTLEDGKVTVQFLKDLIEWYKSQKTLHRKYAYKVSDVMNNQVVPWLLT
jgi:hypothetical protein